MRYPDYQISNIRLLASSILALDRYTGKYAQALIEECNSYASIQAHSNSAFDGLALHAVAIETIKEAGDSALTAELRHQID